MGRARPPPDKPPDIRTFVIDVARVAGFDPGKHQPLPGTQLLWKGCVYLQHATLTYRALKNLDMIKKGNRLNSGELRDARRGKHKVVSLPGSWKS